MSVLVFHVWGLRFRSYFSDSVMLGSVRAWYVICTITRSIFFPLAPHYILKSARSAFASNIRGQWNAFSSRPRKVTAFWEAVVTNCWRQPPCISNFAFLMPRVKQFLPGFGVPFLPSIRPLHFLIFFLAGDAGPITTSASAHNFIISTERNNSNNPHLASYCIAG